MSRIAAVLTSFVTESPLTGFGAGGFMLVHDPGKEDVLIDFFVAAGGSDGLERGAELVPIPVHFDERTTQVFHVGAVATLSDDALRPHVAGHVMALVRRDLIRPDRPAFTGEDAFRFRHLLIRDAAYDALPKATRAELHERFANWLEKHGQDLVELDEILGYHLEQTYSYRRQLGLMAQDDAALAERAARYLAGSGRRAAVRGDATAAARLFRRAAALLPAESSERLKLLPRIGSALTEAGSWDDAKEVLSEAAASAQRVGDRGAAARAAVGLVFVDIHTNAGASHAKARTELEEAIRVFEELDDRSGLARALHMAAMLRLWSGENAQAIEEMTLAAQYAREAGDRAQEIESLAGIMMGLLYGPTPVVTALERIEEIERQSEGARRLQAGALRFRAGLQAMRGEFGEARELIGTADRIAEELGLEVLRAAGILRMAGEIEFLAGDLPAAERFLRKANGMLERDKDWGHLASNAPLLADVLLAQGRADEAEPLIDAAAPWMIEDDNEAQILFRRARSRLAGERGEATNAEELARVAVERAGTGDEVNSHASALVCLADALELRERDEEASAALQDALGLYERKGNVVAAERVRRRLGAG